MSVRLLLVSAFCLGICGAWGQTPDTGTIQGFVSDESGGAVADVAITVTRNASSRQWAVQSDSSGNFSVGALAVDGTYTLAARKNGFADARMAGLSLQGGAAASLHLTLAVAKENTRITVTGVAGEIRTDAPQLGDRISGRQLAETPMLTRRITYLPLLNSANRPAINQGDIFTNQNLFTTNGAGRRQTWFEVDGGTGNDAWGRQTIFTNLPLEAVQEMTVLVNSFSAEFGGSTGSAVNIVTRTGGSRLRGQILEVWRPDATQASLSGFTNTNAANGNDVSSNTLGQTSVQIGGPVGSGQKTHFLAVAEYNRENRTSPITSPIAPGEFVGRYRGWLGFARLDRQLGDHGNLFVRANLDSFFDTNPNGVVGGNSLPSVDRVFRRRTYSTQVGETQVFSPNLFNNARVQFQLASPITQFDPVVYGTQYQVPVSSGGTFTTGTSQSALLMNRQYEASDVLAWVHGRHSIKGGAGVIVAHSGGNSKEFGGPLYLGQFVYNVCTQALTVCESQAYLGDIRNVRTYTQSYGNATYTVDDAIWSAFVQDDFRWRPDLTLNFGFRYERQTFTDFKKGFAPRIGFSYNLLGKGTTVIRGGYGIYYSHIVDNSQANYALTGPTGVFNYSAAPGQLGFPVSVAAAPLPAFPTGALAPVRSLYIRPGDSASLDPFFPTSTLVGYPDRLLNPYSQQWSLGAERRLRKDWVLRADYVGSHTLRINRPLDVDAPAPFVRTAPGQVRTAQAANCTRPYWIWWYAKDGGTCGAANAAQPPYALIQSDVNNGYSYYDALQVNLTGRLGNSLSLLASYTWSHAIDNVDPDVPGQNPNDPNFTGKEEKGSAIFDQRQRFVVSGVWVGKWGLHIGGIGTFATGLPYNFVTGVTNSGDTGATTDRPVIGGAVVGRNAGRGTATYDVSPLVERPFRVNEHLRIEPRIEVFNVFNHPNFVGFSGTYGNDVLPGAGFGQRLAGVTAQLPARSIQFSLKVTI